MEQTANIGRPRLRTIAALLALLFCVTVFSMPTIRAIHGSDFTAHRILARRILDTGTVQHPHFLYHLFLIAVDVPLAAFLGPPLPGDLRSETSVIVTVAFYNAAAVVLYAILRRRLADRGGPFTHAALALSLLAAAPIAGLVFVDRLYYLGYIGIAVYHNPTIVVLKPLALLLFGYAVATVDPRPDARPVRTFALAALLVVLSALAKPTYLIALVPALGLFCGYRLIRGRPFQWWLLAGIIGPALLVLAWQFRLTYTGEQASVIFAPFAVMSRYSAPWTVAPKFFLSIMFPACVYIFYLRRARLSTSLNLAWVVFFVAALYSYFVAESGPRLNNGNFAWSAQTALFILFVESLILFLQREPRRLVSARRPLLRRGVWSAIICVFAGALHVASGIAYYVSVLQTHHFY